MDLIHTKIGPALVDASCWSSITGVLAVFATQAPPAWQPWVCLAATVTGIVGFLLKGSQTTESK